MKVLGGILVVVSLVALFGFVMPRLEAMQQQALLVAPMAMLGGNEAVAEFEAAMQALNVMRLGSIIGALLGAVLFIIGLMKKKKHAD